MTELGDETFIIAAIMAMRHPRLVVYVGAMSALVSMTVKPGLLVPVTCMLYKPSCCLTVVTLAKCCQLSLDELSCNVPCHHFNANEYAFHGPVISHLSTAKCVS